ncbi:hypothetical protein T459_31898 [Capsicum annuum]|uniref:MI domain-containing protein n=1 Tax=Capsicum annuum TaxID=4072 RepID=A0A2G2Y3C1_CAPAN|nr:hypothetical protein T459_31898 [Capsicum annuum]
MEIYSIRKERQRGNTVSEYERMSWDALRKSINGFMNKVNAINIKNTVPELFGENLIRGRGLFCRSIMKSQMASPIFTDVFAALVAVVNSKIPVIGDLLLRRLILQLNKPANKLQLLASLKFVAHLVNQQVVHELIALQLLTVIWRYLMMIVLRLQLDPDFAENEKKYEELKKKILGEESEKEGDADAESDEEEDEEKKEIKDESETNLINFRRTVYQTIMSSVDFEEAGHKLLKIKIEPGHAMELCIMLLECCSQERTFLRYYGYLGQRFCMIDKVYQENFDKCFVQQYSMVHRLETNKLHKDDTTSSSRIFIKILFQELAEHLGIHLLNERLNDPMMQDSFESIFPKDNSKNMRFAINFFTSIGLGGITENLRVYSKNTSRLIMKKQKPVSLVPESESESSDSERDDHRRKKRRRTWGF